MGNSPAQEIIYNSAELRIATWNYHSERKTLNQEERHLRTAHLWPAWLKQGLGDLGWGSCLLYWDRQGQSSKLVGISERYPGQSNLGITLPLKWQIRRFIKAFAPLWLHYRQVLRECTSDFCHMRLPWEGAKWCSFDYCTLDEVWGVANAGMVTSGSRDENNCHCFRVSVGKTIPDIPRFTFFDLAGIVLNWGNKAFPVTQLCENWLQNHLDAFLE